MPAGDRTGLYEVVSEARREAGGRRWNEAAKLCEHELELLDPVGQPLRAGLSTELLAKCHFARAFEADSRRDFERWMKVSHDHYAKATELYEKAGSEALAKKAKAMCAFSKFWSTQDIEERRRIIQECISLATSSLEILERDAVQKQPEIYSDLLIFCTNALRLDTESGLHLEHFEKALEAGKRAIAEFEDVGDQQGLLEPLSLTIRLITVEAQSSVDPSRAETLANEARNLQNRLVTLSEKIGGTYAGCLAKEEAGNIAINIESDSVKALKMLEESASQAIGAYNSHELGNIFLEIASAAEWEGISEEDSKKRQQVLEKGLHYASGAIQRLEIAFHTGDLAQSYAVQANCYINFAGYVETQVDKKRAFLEKAIESASKGTSFETDTIAWQLAAHAESKAMYFLATITEGPVDKERLLRKALSIRENTLRVTDQLLSNFYWSRGVMRNYIALIKAELARMETDFGAKTKLLQEASSHLRECLDLCGKSGSNPGFKQPLAQYCEWYGDILFQLLPLTAETQTAQTALKAYQQSIEYFAESGQLGPLGALNWKIAKVYDSAGDFELASWAFVKAAEAYKLAAEKIPGFKSTFEELTTYMKAWAEIENARIHHTEEQYIRAHETYLRASKLLQSTMSWSRLAMLLDARSLLEKGEGLSREENPGAAVESFRKALDGFRRAKEVLGKMVGTAAESSEKEEIEDWLKVAHQREAYSLGRIELEEAKSLDKAGEKVLSSRKFSSAAASFRTLARQIVSAQDRAEIETLAQFCESWARMKEAESKASPELFAEAAESFIRARETATNPRLRLLAMGNTSICRALESGTRFRQSRDVLLYSEIKRQLEIGADHYTEAGFKKTGTWTRATQRLFDALMLLADAEVERDIRKKTELYHMAEKHFELAAKLYGEAGFPSRKRETLEQLERTREEKEVLLAPLEALAEIPTASATHLPSITLRGAQPLGLERFEDAKVTGELRTPQTHLTTGSDFTVNIDVANVGKTPATLIKLEGIVPEGCEPVEEQSTPNLEGNSLDLRGKRLEYLKTHGIQVSFRPTRKGEFELSPRVVYVDEKGNYKSTNLQPLYLTIREPGISEGLHAPPTVHLPQDFQFENERSRQVFSRLVKEFLDDYMTKRIVMERAGWRSLMDVIRDVKIPRSALYGPGGRTGPVLAELERRGLVETRVFPKERGRGGEIKKVRVASENTIVRRIVDRAVMENA